MKKKKNFSEKFLIFLVILLAVSVPVSIVYSKAELSKSNIEVERIKNKIKKQSSINQSLSMQVDELASLSNIQDVAKEYGLCYNNDNIIVIDEKQ